MLLIDKQSGKAVEGVDPRYAKLLATNNASRYEVAVKKEEPKEAAKPAETKKADAKEAATTKTAEQKQPEEVKETKPKTTKRGRRPNRKTE